MVDHHDELDALTETRARPAARSIQNPLHYLGGDRLASERPNHLPLAYNILEIHGRESTCLVSPTGMRGLCISAPNERQTRRQPGGAIRSRSSHSGDRCCAVGVHPYLDDLGVVNRKHLVGMRSASTLGYWVEYRLDVDYGGAVERFEFADQDPQALHGEDLGPVQADWVGPVG